VKIVSYSVGISRRSLLKAGAAGIASVAVGSRWFLPTSTRAGAEDRTAGTAEKFSAEVAWRWFETLYDVVKAEALAPTLASRVYGIASVALYESIVGRTRQRPLSGQLNGLSSVPDASGDRAHWPTVANTVLFGVVSGLLPQMSQPSRDRIAGLAETLEETHSPSSGPRRDRSVAHGEEVAAAILGWAAGDGYDTFHNCPYRPAAVAGAWQPTPPVFNPNPLEPCWGEIRPMVLTSGAEISPPGHPAFSTELASDFYAAALDVYEVGVNLTAEQKTIANYWADNAGVSGTPPGHWIAIVSQIARNDDLSLADAAEAYARVGIAMHDAFICCWHTKYLFNLMRPVTYINEQIDPAWLPFIPTPPFPTYTSGHSTQSGAAAFVLTDMFGERTFTDTTHTDHGLTPAQQPRTFQSFEEAALEAAVSRLYGGIHYTFDNEDGFEAGQEVGRLIVDRVTF
jgi:PAP2 superfamily